MVADQYEEDEGEGDPIGRDGDYDPNDPNNREEEKEDDDDDNALADDVSGDADHDGDAVMAGATAAGARPTVRTKSAQLRAFRDKYSLVVAAANPDGHCGFMSVALQPAKPSRTNPSMSSQIKTLRVAVANIIEKKENRPHLAHLLTGCSFDDAERTLLQRAKEHRKINTSVALSHSTGMWFNHVDAQALATFKERTVIIVDAKSATANKIPPLPDRAKPNIELGKVELPDDAIVLLFANSHYDALLKQAK